MCGEASVPLIVNDRADIARLLGAGLHVGQDDLAPRDARTVLGAEPILGFSTHNPRQLLLARDEPVDYLAVGPVFETSSKRNPDPVVGLECIRAAREGTRKPLVAIGGITLQNASLALQAGADSIAVIGGLLPAGATATTLRQRMEEWQQLLNAV